MNGNQVYCSFCFAYTPFSAIKAYHKYLGTGKIVMKNYVECQGCGNKIEVRF